jgi:elongation factor Ts
MMTGAGLMDCKKALLEARGDIEKAIEILKEKGLAVAKKKSERVAREGAIDAYIHQGGRLGVLIEVNCETDFVARSEGFRTFVHDVAMHIAAAKPRYLSKEEVPEEERRELSRDETDEFYRGTCLLDQIFIRDEKLTVRELLTNLIAKMGENIVIRRFARFEVGE